MRVRVGGVAVVGVVRRHQGQGQLTRQVHGLPDHGRELGVVVVLHLQVVAVAEGLAVPARDPARVLASPLLQGAVQLARRAAREHDQALAVLRQQLAVDAGVVVEAVQVGLGGERYEVVPAPVVLRQQGQVRGALAGGRVPIAVALPGDVGLHAEHGVQPGRLGGLVEIDGPVEVAVIGDRDRLLAKGPRPLHERGNLGEAVQQAELRVRVQVREHGFDASVAKAPG